MSGLIDSIKTLGTLAKTISSIEVRQQLIVVQTEALELVEQNRSLNDKVAELEGLLKTKGALSFRNNFYWLAGENGEEGPFCSRCKDEKQMLVRLHGFDEKFLGCPGCGQVRDRHGKIAYPRTVEKFNLDRAIGRPSGGRH